MKRLPILLAAFAFALAALFAYLWTTGRAPTAAAAGEVRDALARGETERLGRAFDELRGEFERLARESPLQESRSPRAPAAPPPLSVQGSAEQEPRWYLERYLASFEHEQGGATFFRLAVEAQAGELLEPIAGVILDRSRADPPRVILTAMLGSKRFHGDLRALDVLLRAARLRDKSPVAPVALDAAGAIAQAGALQRFEDLIWTLESGHLRQRALEIALRLAAPQGNALLGRLLASAPDPAGQAWLYSFLVGADPEGALAVLESALGAEREVRLAAAQALSEFEAPEPRAFAARWLEIETDREVRRLLEHPTLARSKMARWHALQATGPPDAERAQDDPHAWASALPDGGQEWLELVYDPPLVAESVRVHEVNAGGALIALWGYDVGGGEHALWAGRAGGPEPGEVVLSFPRSAFPVARLRLVLDTRFTPGWNEIDAVRLVGPEGSAWGARASASSSYGQK